MLRRLSSSEETGESDTESDDDENSDDDVVIADLDEHSTVRMPVLTKNKIEWDRKHNCRHGWEIFKTNCIQVLLKNVGSTFFRGNQRRFSPKCFKTLFYAIWSAFKAL